MNFLARVIACTLWLQLAPLAASAGDLPAGVMRVDGITAPALQLDDIDGKPYDLASTHGHWRGHRVSGQAGAARVAARCPASRRW